MKHKLPFIALWTSILYMAIVLGVMGKISSEVEQIVHKTIGGLKPGVMLDSGKRLDVAWVAQQADAAFATLWLFVLLLAGGIIATAASALWVTLARPSAPAD
jgi:hypothetical protein